MVEAASTGAGPGNRQEQVVAGLERRALSDQLRDGLLQALDLPAEPGDAGADLVKAGGAGDLVQAVYLAGALPDQLLAPGGQLLHFRLDRIGPPPGWRIHHPGKAGDRESIQAVGLGDVAAGVGEAPGAVRVSDGDPVAAIGRGRAPGGVRSRPWLPGRSGPCTTPCASAATGMRERCDRWATGSWRSPAQCSATRLTFCLTPRGLIPARLDKP